MVVSPHSVRASTYNTHRVICDISSFLALHEICKVCPKLGNALANVGNDCLSGGYDGVCVFDIMTDVSNDGVRIHNALTDVGNGHIRINC